jgi:hypothetical protein
MAWLEANTTSLLAQRTGIQQSREGNITAAGAPRPTAIPQALNPPGRHAIIGLVSARRAPPWRLMMKSPFPGMDPYLEAHWGDVHARLVTYASDQLAQQMPPHLKVRIEEYVAVEIEDEPLDHRYIPDVRVFERPGSASVGADSGSATAVEELVEVEEPLWIPLTIEPPTQREIRIVDARDGGRLVTAIEFLSLTNKTTGREDYRRKQAEIIEGGANLVEIDLLRSGRWVLAAGQRFVKKTHRGPYRICLVRASAKRTGLYRASFSRPLPNIQIPLRPSDKDAVLRLQPLIEQAYINGQYGDLDYRSEPDPPFMEEERLWADELLKKLGKRK